YAGAVRADHGDALRPEIRVRAQHLVHGDVLGDADHRHDPRVDGLVDCIGREARRHEDERRIRVGLLDRIHDRVKHGDAFDILAALAGRDAGNDVRAVALVAQAVEAALAAREALDDEPRVGVDDDRHYFGTPLRTITSGRL